MRHLFSKIAPLCVIVMLLPQVSSGYTISGEITGGLYMQGITFVGAYSELPDTMNISPYCTIVPFGNGNYFINDVPEDHYIILAFQDLNGNFFPDPGDYIGYYGGLPPEVIYLNSNMSGADIEIAAQPEGYISGDISYSGGETGPTFVEVFDNPNFLGSPVSFGILHYFEPSIMIFSFDGNGYYEDYVPAGTYYLRAYMDLDFSFTPDPGEPYGEYRDAGGLIPVTIDSAQQITGINFALDPPIITVNPTAFYVTLVQGDSATETLTIGNMGESDLEFDIELSYSAPGTDELGDVIRTIPAPSYGITGLAYVDGSLWAASDYYWPPIFYELDPEDGTVLSQFSFYSDGFVDITYDGSGGFWLVDWDNDVSHLDMEGNQLSYFYLYGYPRSICWDGEYLWIGREYYDYFAQVDTLGNIIRTVDYYYPIDYPRGAEWVEAHPEGHMWVADYGSEEICQLNVQGDEIEIIQQFTTPTYNEPYGITHDGENLWISGYGDSEIYLVDDGIIEYCWLSIAPASGTVSPGGAVDVSVNIDASETEPGDYELCMVINSNDVVNPEFVVPVYLTVLPDSTFAVGASPINPPIIIPEVGGSFDYIVSVMNTYPTPQTFDIWTYILLPGAGMVGPIILLEDVTRPGNSVIERERTQAVPGAAPGGIYTYYACLGDHPWVVTSVDSFTFEKLGGADGYLGIPSDWICTGEPFAGEALSSLHSSSFILHPSYPNPFNPETVISFELPVASFVELVVYDIQGREVARLVDGLQPAGVYEAVFDGSQLASGVYFARLTANNFHQTQKLLLIK